MKFQGDTYYLKCYRPQGMSKIMKNFFRPADAVRYFKIADKLGQAGISIAPPVLALTRRTSLRPADSIFVTREVPGTELYNYLLEGAQHDPEQRKQMVIQFAFMWSKLIRLNLVHLDPWLGNFMVNPGQKAGDIHIELIDVDNIYPRPLLPRKLLWLLNVKRLNYKLERVNFPVTQAETELFLAELDKFLKESL
ncbi:lipopolysaccharide kinase InaA family protein [Sporomusa sphaeroides]|uniref:lipopolysaccharide kinase InaA family protein n=1 Tax=Sporomusa sphaeroides TaxID=47679 RepID=UPI002547687C|nr:lipopolysaccharide kinase InaA family protein [Sporomusa sphaeroides]